MSRGGVLVDLRAGAERLEHLGLDCLRGVLAVELVDHLGGRVERVAEALPDLARDRLVHLLRLDLDLLLAGLLAQVVLGLAEPLDLGVCDIERVEDLRLGDFVGARLDHQDGLLGAGDHQVERRLEQPLLVRVDEEVALGVLADPHGAHGHRERDVGHHQRGARAVHREDVVGVLVVDRHRDRHELCLPVPALREQRPERPVDHARGERGLLARPALALEETAGDLARGVHPFLDVNRQREEVHVARVPRGCGAQDHRVARLNYDGATGLSGVLAGLEANRAPADLEGDPARAISHVFPFSRLRLAALLLKFRCEPERL